MSDPTVDPAPRVEFRGRQVHADYPERHVYAQATTHYDFPDGQPRARIRYGDARDRYPGGITYATREEAIAEHVAERARQLAQRPNDADHRAWVDQVFPHADNPDDLVKDMVFRTDHRCADCGVDVHEYHLVGCDLEVCPRCGSQSISCGCSSNDADDESDDA